MEGRGDVGSISRRGKKPAVALGELELVLIRRQLCEYSGEVMATVVARRGRKRRLK
jgi:hypothetical protein